MAFDPLLYVALAGGIVAGRLIRYRPAWLPRATLATVIVLLLFLGADVAHATGSQDLSAVPIAIGFAATLVVLTAVFAWLFGARARGSVRARLGRVALVSVVLPFLIAFLAGLAIGRVTPLPLGSWIEPVLYVLVALVGLDLRWSSLALRRAWLPLLAAVSGAVASAALFSILNVLSPSAAFATAFGFAFYSLTGPLVAARLGATLGLVAFLSNYLRESFTMLASPELGGWIGGEGLTAVGGAAAMDTTLYFITKYGDRESASLAMSSGLVLTVLATVAVPLLLSFPRA